MAKKVRVVVLATAMFVLMLGLAACAGAPPPAEKSAREPPAYKPETKVKKGVSGSQ
jgi:hypothetical protein